MHVSFIIVIDEKIELTLRRPKVQTECGKLNIELKELTVKEYFSQSDSSNNQTTREPSHNNASNLSEDEELRILAQLINTDSGDGGIMNRSNTTNLSSSPRGNSQAELLLTPDHNLSNTRSSPVGSTGTPQSTPSLSTNSSPQPPPQTATNSESRLMGTANVLSGQSNLTTPQQASNGPSRTGGQNHIHVHTYTS